MPKTFAASAITQYATAPFVRSAAEPPLSSVAVERGYKGVIRSRQGTSAIGWLQTIAGARPKCQSQLFGTPTHAAVLSIYLLAVKLIYRETAPPSGEIYRRPKTSAGLGASGAATADLRGRLQQLCFSVLDWVLCAMARHRL